MLKNKSIKVLENEPTKVFTSVHAKLLAYIYVILAYKYVVVLVNRTIVLTNKLVLK